MQIRPATVDDIPLLSDIMVTSFRAAFSGFISETTMSAQTDSDHCRGMMETIFRDSTMHFLLGDSSGMLIWQETQTGAEIMSLHVLPECRGTGLGHALMEAALAQTGSSPVCLWTFRENHHARRFYERHGFRPDGRERVSSFDDVIEVCYTLIPR